MLDRKKGSLLVALLVIAVFGGLFVRNCSRRLETSQLLEVVRQERAQRLQAIWRSLSHYYDKNKTYPKSEREWLQFDPSLDTLLQTPKGSSSPRYHIRYDAIGSDIRFDVITGDPPGDYAPHSRLPSDITKRQRRYRMALLNDGSVVQLRAMSLSVEETVNALYSRR